MRLAWLLVAGCAAEPAILDVPPAPPGKADSGDYQVTGAKSWYLVGDALTTADSKLELAIAGPGDAFDAWLDGQHVASGRQVAIDLAGIAPGEHELLLQADHSHYAFAALPFHVSHPLYVVVTNDWDTGDHTDDKLERQERLHARHPHLAITHFVGPYTFTDPTVSAARAQHLVDWLHASEAKGDEIGLHIHPYCNFVTAAGVTCRTAPSFAHASDTTGYTVILASYTRPELDKLFAKADELFVAHGLAKPTSFRAGGWTADLHVLASLAAHGHVADTSAVNWAKLEEWEGRPDASIYEWNREHWMPIDQASQPYYPATDDVLADAAPHLPILEVPDNGALVDYVTGAEMIAMFRTNFDGKALATTQQYSIGYHPVDFSEDFFIRLDTALTEIDKHLAADDAGPVIYIRESDTPKAFPRSH